MKKNNSIGGKLLLRLVPLIAVAITAIMIVVFIQSKAIIEDLSISSLADESNSNSATISSDMQATISSFDATVNAIKGTTFANDTQIKKTLMSTMSIDKKCPNGIYIAIGDTTYIDPSGWTPDASWKATERDWYTVGKSSNEFIFGEPYVDDLTGEIIVTMSRTVTLRDGRTGVAAVDMQLTDIVNQVASFKPMKTGSSLLVDDNYILAYDKEGYSSTLITEHSDDDLLSQVTGIENAEDGKAYTVNSNGTTYLVVVNHISGTDWVLYSFVEQSTVLSALRNLQIICMLLTLITLVIISLVIIYVSKNTITAPVAQLTKDLQRISDGDFTVIIKDSGNDEIGQMNKNMGQFVVKMRDSLFNLKDASERLSLEAENTKQSSEAMNGQASNQSNMMEQIKTATEGVAQSVVEVATDATRLAQAVSDLTDKGNDTNKTMSDLVVKAKQGQSDMANVHDNMENISVSMDKMNEVVERVGEAAGRINSIIDMINSISSQTNLLSLNASIEAARAGEAGRGFAVVAGEIGNLAKDSASATTEIRNIIEEITGQINELAEASSENTQLIQLSNDSVNETAKTFKEIFEALDETGLTMENMIQMISQVNDIATNVAAIAEEQSASTEEVAATVEASAQSAEDVAEESEKVDAAAQNVSKVAEQIEEIVGLFKIQEELDVESIQISEQQESVAPDEEIEIINEIEEVEEAI